MTNTIDRYEVRAELGRGGMATVYLAYDPRFGREVAIKVLPASFLHDPSFRSRFEREARTIAALEHPAIVPVHDVGEHEGQPYLVMRLMKGSLEEKLRAGPLSLAEAAALYTRLASALDQAHRQGIIHRDLKPGNILFDAYGAPYISDFGIVKLSEASEKLSMSGSVMGTPSYMSPEQAHGDREVDGRSDIYTMGVILFEVLTGKTPYQAETPVKMMMKHVLEPVPLIREVNPELSPGVEAIIARAMAKDPQERYATAGEMAEALSALAEGRVTAVPVEGTVISAPPAVATAATEMITPSSPITPLPRPVPPPPSAPAPAVTPSRAPLFWIGGILGAILLLYVASLALGALLGTGNEEDASLEPTAPATSQEIGLSFSATEEEEADEDMVDLTDAIDIQEVSEINSFQVSLVMRMEGDAYADNEDLPGGLLSLDGNIVKDPPAQRLLMGLNTGDPRLDHIEAVRVGGRNFLKSGGQWAEVPNENMPDINAVLFIKPDDLQAMDAVMEFIDEEVVNDRDTVHYQGGPEALTMVTDEEGNPTEVTENALLDVWLDSETGFVVKMIIEASGMGLNSDWPEAEGRLSIRLEYSNFNEPFSITPPQ